MKRELMGGINAVEALMEQAPQTIVRIWLKSGSARLDALRKKAADLGIPVETADERSLDKRLPDVAHQGVVAEFQARPPMTEHELFDLIERTPNPLILVLDGVQDPNNLGACMRSAAAAGAVAVVVPKDRATGLTPAARKASAGASEMIPLAAVTNLARTLTALQQANLWTVGLVMDAELSLFSSDMDDWFRGGLAIVMGGEGAGLRRLTAQHCDRLVHIPMPGATESLNVSVAAAVALFSVVRARSQH